MNELSVTAGSYSPHPPGPTFAQIASGELLHLECDRFEVGGAVSVPLPLSIGAPGDLGTAESVALLGHIAAIRPSKSVVVVHHQPWRGRLTVRLYPHAGGTRIVLEDQLGDDGLAWLADRRGFNPVLPPRADRHRIGLLVSKSGSAAVFAQATETLAALAIDEINADGGIRGVQAELVVGDDASRASTAVQVSRRLAQSGCRAIFACVTSASFNAAAAALRDSGVPIIHSVLNEGGPPLRTAIRLGERPFDQARLAVPMMMAQHDARRWFLVGHRYSWSYGAHWAARRVISDNGGTVVGEVHAPLGTSDFSETIDRITESRAELILSSLVGHDEALFEKQCARAGLRTSTHTLALVLDEATLQLVGAADSDGVIAAFRYFEGMDHPNRGLEARYSAQAQKLSPPMSSLSETTYQAILRYATTSPQTDTDLDTVRSTLLNSPDIGRSSASEIVVAEARNGTFRPV